MKEVIDAFKKIFFWVGLLCGFIDRDAINIEYERIRKERMSGREENSN